MSKVYTYMVVSIGLIFLLKFAGLPTGADVILSYLGLDSGAAGVSLGTFFAAIATLFAVGTGTGIAISFFTKSPSETYLVAPICLGVFTVITTTFISIVNYTKDMGYVYYITWLIFIPLLLGFGMAIISYWRGGDN